MPVESSLDYAGQLLPSLLTVGSLDTGVWGRAKAEFDQQIPVV
jgi:saccharopine dehydrogenase (NAD+, L-lysine-forming)